MDLTFITGNQHKADYLARVLGIPVAHSKVDLEEIQSLDLGLVVEHKALRAYDLVGSPVLVEDIALVMHGLGSLPGPFIKWFLQELGNEGLAKLAHKLNTQAATVSIMYGLFDGKKLRTFEGHTRGKIAPTPRGRDGFGFQYIFIPEGHQKTYAEMDEAEMEPIYHRTKAINKLREYLQQAG